MTDIQALIDTMADASMRERSNYHLTYGDLIKVLKAAPADATFDKRVTGIGSYRGYYSDIALFTGESGYSCEDEEYEWIGDMKDYGEWVNEHRHDARELPTNANELGELLESLISKQFTGYKGGNFTITESKPLWLEHESNECSELAVIGMDNDLNLITKGLREEND